MTEQDKTPHPLDHATARIITELAAALLPPLKDILSAELARTIKTLPIDVDKEAEEVLSSLRHLQALTVNMANILDTAQNSALLLSDELLPLSRSCETLNVAAVQLKRIASVPENAGAAEETAEINKLLRSLEIAVSEWAGILKANGHAQTRELSEFSEEVSEQFSWMKSDMPQVVRSILEKMLSSQAEKLMKLSEENVRILEMRLMRLEKFGKIILVGSVIFIALLTALYLK